MSTKQQEQPASRVARETALGEVQTLEAALAKWTGERDGALADLERLQGGAGTMVLDDEDAAVRLPREMQEARDRADIAERAIAAAGPKLQAAREVAVMAEADELGASIAAARQAVEEFDAKTARLLTPLVKHTGLPWQQVTLKMQADRFFAAHPGPGSFQGEGAPADRELRSRLAGLELQQQVLRAAAAGENVREAFPELSWVELPESLRPGGVMPQPGFSDPVAGAEARLRAREEQFEQDSADLEDLERRIERIEAQVREHAGEALPYILEQQQGRLPELRRDVERLKSSVVNLPVAIERERAVLERARATVPADRISA